LAEKLIPLTLPPGLFRNGTVYQAAKRWFDGNLVRFFQGTVQPVGGWVQRTLTGAAIAGTPNAACAWSLNDGTAYIAVGTTSGLYVVSSANVVYDILTVGLAGGTPYKWHLTPFGSSLIAVYELATYSPLNSINVLQWAGDTAVKAVQAFSFDGPNTSFGALMTAERFLVVLRGSDPNAAGWTVPPAIIN
jgi:hypothetical protein